MVDTQLLCEKCDRRPRISTRRKRCTECDPLCRGCETGRRNSASHYCSTCQASRRREWYKNDPENRAKRLASNKAGNDALRLEVLMAYGHACACPGCYIIEAEFLTLDHVDNDGAAERKATGLFGGIQFYRYVRSLGCPRDRYQLLCWNCNLAKHIYGKCPHTI